MRLFTRVFPALTPARTFATLLLCSFLFIAPAARASDTLRVMVYNLLKYGIPQSGCTPLTPTQKNPHLSTILNAARPDIFAVNEIGTSSLYADNILVNVLQPISTDYARCTHTNNATADESNHLFYNSAKLGLGSQSVINHSLRDINVYRLFYKDANLATTQDTTWLTCIVVHLKAGSTTSDQNTRDDQATLIMNYLATLPAGSNFLVMGDFNIQSSSEACYQTFTAGANVNARLYDPISSPGSWNNNSSFAAIHTQSTRANSSADCGSGGGLDDRFDFILASSAVLNHGNGLRYLSGTYKAYGNDGQHFNGNINNSPANSAVSTSVANALYAASDHLPVILDLDFDTSPVTALAPQAQASLSLYPVPAADHVEITVTGSQPGLAGLHLRDLQGRLLYSERFIVTAASIHTELPLQGLPAGVYLVEYEGPEGGAVVKKLIKR